MAAAMAQQRRYGLAVAYCVRAWDATQVRRIADQLLDEYVSHGSATFVSLVDTIPASLLQPASHSLGGTGNGLTDGYGDPDLLDTDADADGESIPTYGRGRALFSNRLAFLVRYRDFHNLYAQGQMRRAAQLLVMLLTSNVAPQRFWAILLVDAVPLLEGAYSSPLFHLHPLIPLEVHETCANPREVHETCANNLSPILLPISSPPPPFFFRMHPYTLHTSQATKTSSRWKKPSSFSGSSNRSRLRHSPTPLKLRITSGTWSVFFPHPRHPPHPAPTCPERKRKEHQKQR